MPQEAPADTAGPSSPPPRMPEGWLPQWEGVQRKWYYVQRATGKSQWDIPTEPVVLTPSTTPTSIGTGPSLAPPSRPSTNSPQVTGLTNTLAERIEAAAANTQLNGQAANVSLGYAEKPGWYQDQAIQNPGHTYVQNAPLAESGYSSGLHLHHQHGVSGNTSIGPSSYWPGNSVPNHVVGPQLFVGNSWGHNTNVLAGHASGYNQQHQDPYRNLAMGPQPSHQMESYSSPVPIPESQAPGVSADQPPPQPQWRVEQQPAHQNAPHYPVSTNPGSTNSPRASSRYESYPTPQTSGWSPGDFPSRSSQSSEHSHPGSEYSSNRSAQPAGHSMARTQSHHSPFHQQLGNDLSSPGNLQTQGYPQQPLPSHAQYASPNMAGSQTGTGFNSMVFPRPRNHTILVSFIRTLLLRPVFTNTCPSNSQLTLEATSQALGTHINTCSLVVSIINGPMQTPICREYRHRIPNLSVVRGDRRPPRRDLLHRLDISEIKLHECWGWRGLNW
ncbi:hypothetical protein N7454_008256 [Penicillium verhagenii]|nr:hypothetical protein N7454_008256 [Penicillium verhagenii]